MRKSVVIFISVFMLSSLLIAGCVRKGMDENRQRELQPVMLSLDESQEYAINAVKNMPEFVKYDGDRLVLREAKEIEWCDSCWSFIYTFEIRERNGLSDNAIGFKVDIPIMQGQIGNVNVEKIESSSPVGKDSCNTEEYWCEGMQRCINSSESCIPDISEAHCRANAGNWNECGNRCSMDIAGRHDAYCAWACEKICECGDTPGFLCPDDYECRKRSDITNAVGYCVPKGYENTDVLAIHSG